MLRTSLPILAVAGITTFASCAPAPAPGASTPVPAATPAASVTPEAEIRAVSDAWVAAFNRDDAAAVAALYAPAGVHVAGRRLEGTAAIREAIASAAAATTATALSNRRVSVSGDYAFETGIATQTLAPSAGQPSPAVSEYIAVYARQPTGGWKIQSLVVGPPQGAAPAVERTIAEYFAAIRGGNPDAWVGTFAPTAVVEDPVGAPAMHGHEPLRQFFTGMGQMFERIGLTEEEVVVGGNHAAVKWVGHAVARNGREVHFEGVDVYEFDSQGKIQRMWAYWNPAPVVAAAQQ